MKLEMSKSIHKDSVLVVTVIAEEVGPLESILLLEKL